MDVCKVCLWVVSPFKNHTALSNLINIKSSVSFQSKIERLNPVLEFTWKRFKLKALRHDFWLLCFFKSNTLCHYRLIRLRWNFSRCSNKASEELWKDLDNEFYLKDFRLCEPWLFWIILNSEYLLHMTMKVFKYSRWSIEFLFIVYFSEI